MKGNKSITLNVNLLTLSFRNELEKKFRNFYFENSIVFVRISTLIGIVFFAAFFFLDASVYSHLKKSLFIIRFGVVCPVLLISFALSFTNIFRKWWQCIVTISILVAGVGIVVIANVTGNSQMVDYFPGIVIVILYSYLFIKLRFIWASVSGWLIVAIYIITNLLLQKSPDFIVTSHSFILISVNLLGMFGSYYLEYFTRKNFFLGLLLAEEQEKVIDINKELEQRVLARSSELKKEIEDHKKTLEKEKEYLRKSNLLAETAIRLVGFSREDNIYAYIGEQVRDFIDKDCYVIVSSLIAEDNVLKTEAIVGLGDSFKKMTELLGFNPLGRTFDATPMKQQNYKDDKFHLFDGGLYEIFLQSVPKLLCKTIEKVFGLGKIYAIKLKRDSEIFGSLVIILKDKNEEVKDISLIETFLRQAAIAIQKQQIEEKLIVSEERFKKLSNLTFEGILIHKDGVIIDANESLQRMLDFDIEDVVGKNMIKECVLPEFHELIYINMQKEEVLPYEIIMKKSDGTLLPVELETREIEGTVTNFRVTAIRDITERKEAERNLRESEKKHRNIIETTSEGYVFVNNESVINDVNMALCKILSCSENDVLGRSIYEFVDDDVKSNLNELINTEKQFHHKIFESSLTNSNGDYVPTIISASAMFDESGRKLGFFAFITDISERRRIENELKKVENLKSIGTLAGGIAHDFNNILTGIYGNISLLQQNLNLNDNQKEIINNVQNSMYRAKKLTGQLLTFSKGGNPVKESVALKDVVIDLVKFDLSGSNVKPVFDIDDDLMRVEVDRGQIQQVFSNLTINADQATPDGGKLYVSAKNVTLDDDEIKELEAGKYILVTFRDEGRGIEKENLERIFEPYFTTKETGNGLGLAVAYSIIKKHKGHVLIESEFGRGTMFKIYLPAVELNQNTDEIPEDKASETEKSVNKKVLIMDDEFMIRKVASKMLDVLGFENKAVCDGEEAIEEYSRSIETGQPYDVIIMDLTIPGGMGGVEAVKHILKINEKAKVVVSSGYSSDSTISDFKKQGFSMRMEKPYTLDSLEKILESL